MSGAMPRDPVILLSYVNTKLRDEYSSLQELCEETDTDRDALTAKLGAIGYHYDEKTNQFRGEGRKARLKTRQLKDFSVVERLYNTRLKKDFARNELRPLSSMRRSWEENAYDCYGLFDGDAILGYAFFVRKDNNYLFDYFAIAEEHRDEGLGSIFLRQLAECFRDADCVVGEIEDPDKAKDEETRSLRERRLQFYLRSGYRKTELTSTVFGVDYRILKAPAAKEHTTEELRAIYTELYRSILPAMFFRTQFRIS